MVERGHAVLPVACRSPAVAHAATPAVPCRCACLPAATPLRSILRRRSNRGLWLPFPPSQTDLKDKWRNIQKRMQPHELQEIEVG